MLIWLPPSEGKNAPAVGSALSLESLSHPGLTADRRKVADALIELGAGSQAASTLKVGDRIDLSVNETLMSAPWDYRSRTWCLSSVFRLGLRAKVAVI